MPGVQAEYVLQVFRRIRYFVSDIVYWLRAHLGRGAKLFGLFLVVAAVGVGAYLAISAIDDDEAAETPAPQVFVRTEDAPEETADLGFPAFATRNTTRVAGIDPIADAAGSALAAFPSTGGVEGPAAVVLADATDWPGAIAAASLVAAPIQAPILLTDGGETPELTADALRSLDPRGSAETGDDQIFTIGDAPAPGGLRSRAVEGSNPAEIAAEVARLRERLTGDEPEHVLIASSDSPEYAMPAASWAARSGDAILYAQTDSLPEPTIEALQRYKKSRVFLLGPEAAISEKAEKAIKAITGDAVRVEGDDPVANAIEFARFIDGNFGWNINDPGHGFVLANVDRPADAAAAAPLSVSGSWGPLLLTDSATTAPADLEGYLLDLKPGYEDDPTRAVYNHIWVIGDEKAVSVEVQAELDEIAEVAPIRSGSGDDFLGPAPGTPEPETPDKQADRNSKP